MFNSLIKYWIIEPWIKAKKETKKKEVMSLNKIVESFLVFLDNSVLDENLFELVAVEIGFKSLGEVILVGFEGVQISSSSDLELGDSLVLLDKDGWINISVLLLAALVLASLAFLFPLVSSRNCLKSVISLG